MLYDDERMLLTKERLEDLRKEKKLSFEQLAKQLSARGTVISHTNLKNYEISDHVHPLYGRTRSMSIEYLVAFADYYDVSVEYLLGLSDSRKREYHDISVQLGLSDDAIEALVRSKERSEFDVDTPKFDFEQETFLANDFLTSKTFEYVMEKMKSSIFFYMMHKQSKRHRTVKKRTRDLEKIEEMRSALFSYGYICVEESLVSSVEMENAIGALNEYLRALPKRLFGEENDD